MKVPVMIEIPEGYELAEPEMRVPKYGTFQSPYTDGHKRKYAIGRLEE